MTDYELMVNVKNGCVDSKLKLWERYNSKVQSTFFKNKKFFTLMGVLHEDFVQEAYFAFEKCIDYINLEKMKKSGASFGTSFYWFLLKLKNKYKIKKHRMGFPIYLSEIITQDKSSREYSLNLEFLEKTSTTFNEEYEKNYVFSLVQDFIHSQNDENKKVLQWYIEGVSIKEISRRVDISYSKVYKYINKTKSHLTEKYKNQAI